MTTTPSQPPHQRIRLGMIGGGSGAFIGAVHRAAARLDDRYHLVAGCLASTPERSLASGAELGLEPARTYPTWQAMLEGERELPPERRIAAVSIVTPNHTHAAIATAFTTAGFHVICDKPLCNTVDEARSLVAAARNSGRVFAVTYNYSGYPMVRAARTLVAEGRIGPIRKVVVEYNQGWLATRLEAQGQKQADWRTDPARAGAGGAIGDIGTHAEHLARCITGLSIASVCADLTSFVPGRVLDDDASVLLRFAPASSGAPAAKGVLLASQIMIGRENDLSIRVHGERGSLAWQQQDPDTLLLSLLDQPDAVLRRGQPGLGPAAARATRLPSGHPEAFLEAFANIYTGVADAIVGRTDHAEFPDVLDGAHGVAFIDAVVQSSYAGAVWSKPQDIL